jgi:hypothetical protein
MYVADRGRRLKASLTRALSYEAPMLMEPTLDH